MVSFRTMVLVVAFVFFSLQMIFALNKYLAKPSMSSPGHKAFTNLDKPMLISVCKASQFNYTKASKIGYHWATDYLAGVTSNKSVLSWTGLDGNMTFNETFNFLYDTGIENINIEAGNGSVTHRFWVPHGLCKVFEGFITENIVPVYIKNSAQPSTYIAFISDPVAASIFQLPYSLMTGDKINIDTVSKVSKFVDYNIRLKETKVKTDDGTCADYPTLTHQSYADCVDNEMRAKILLKFGCMVPRISRKDSCTGTITDCQRMRKLLNGSKTYSLFLGEV